MAPRAATKSTPSATTDPVNIQPITRQRAKKILREDDNQATTALQAKPKPKPRKKKPDTAQLTSSRNTDTAVIPTDSLPIRRRSKKDKQTMECTAKASKKGKRTTRANFVPTSPNESKPLLPLDDANNDTINADIELEPDMPSVEVDDLSQNDHPSYPEEVILQLQREIMSLKKDLQAAKAQAVKRGASSTQSTDVLHEHQSKRRKTVNAGPNPDVSRDKIARQRRHMDHFADTVLATQGNSSHRNSTPHHVNDLSQQPSPAIPSIDSNSHNIDGPSRPQSPSANTTSNSVSRAASIWSMSPVAIVSQLSNLRAENFVSEPVVHNAKNKPDPQLHAYSSDNQKLLQQAKRYMHAYLITLQAFPDTAQLEVFVVQAFIQAQKDTSIDLELDEGKAKLLRVHASQIRSSWKEAARSAIKLYEITGTPEMKQERVIYLLEKYRYLYGDISFKSVGTLKEKRAKPFAHPAIASVIESVVFGHNEGPARLFNGSLKPIPLATLAFAAVAILNALSEYRETGISTTLSFDPTTYRPKYESLFNYAIDYSDRKPEQCEALQLEIYKDGMLAITKKCSGLSDDDDFTVGDSSDSDGSSGDVEVDIIRTGAKMGGNGVTESTSVTPEIPWSESGALNRFTDGPS